MSHSTIGQLQSALDRMRGANAADRARARDEVIKLAYDRYRSLATLMLNDMSALRKTVQSDDVYQNAWVALHKAFETVEPQDEKHLRSLIRQHVRWQLLEMLRSPNFKNWEDFGPAGSASEAPEARVAAADSIDPAKLVEWTEFHTQAGKLPEREREVFDRIYYDGLSQQEAADELGCSVALIKLRWAEAKKSLSDKLGGKRAEG